MGWTKEKRENLIKYLKEKPIWLLEMKVARQNRLLIELKSQGILSNDKKWRRTCLKRNYIRKILFEKLKSLYKGELKESNPDYSDYLAYEKDKRNNEYDVTMKEKEVNKNADT